MRTDARLKIQLYICTQSMDQTCKRKHCFSRNCEEIKERSEVGEDDLRLGGDDYGRLTLKLRDRETIARTLGS
ncbi:hypothetical protein Sjap_006581 [Stephania japonica]|uniref:Uncharacterized protein n=1 Tax=Stephania japonica TaxID=461633 RepID=A0AAP0PJ19_9MAGN